MKIMNRELSNRLEDDNYMSPLEGFKDWHLLKTKAIQRIDIANNYIHLLDKEPYYEN